VKFVVEKMATGRGFFFHQYFGFPSQNDSANDAESAPSTVWSHQKVEWETAGEF
jgi:hypothetical protein